MFMDDNATDRVFELAAQLFATLATPTRLRIMCELFEGDKNVSELLDCVGVSQPNISQHLGMLYRAGIVTRERQGAHVYYRLASGQATHLCEAVCPQRQLPTADSRSSARVQ